MLNSYPVVKSGFKIIYASNVFPLFPLSPFLSVVFFFSRRSFKSFMENGFPPGSFHTEKVQVLSFLPWHSNAFPLSMIGFPHFGHFNPVSFASGLYHTSFPSLIINAASNFEPSFRLNPFITPVGSPSISFATCASVSVFSQILLHRIKSHSEHLYVAGVLIIGFPHFGQTKSVFKRCP